MVVSRAIKPIQQNFSITSRTTPVVYFGEYDKAKSCTISINPSDREFCDIHGKLLEGNRERYFLEILSENQMRNHFRSMMRIY